VGPAAPAGDGAIALPCPACRDQNPRENLKTNTIRTMTTEFRNQIKEKHEEAFLRKKLDEQKDQARDRKHVKSKHKNPIDFSPRTAKETPGRSSDLQGRTCRGFKQLSP
jgi:hypothetical protein